MFIVTCMPAGLVHGDEGNQAGLTLNLRAPLEVGKGCCTYIFGVGFAIDCVIAIRHSFSWVDAEDKFDVHDEIDVDRVR